MTDRPRIILEGKSLGEYFELIIKNKKLKDELYAKKQECEELRQLLKEIRFWAKELLKRTGQIVPNEIKQILQKTDKYGVNND